MEIEREKGLDRIHEPFATKRVKCTTQNGIRLTRYQMDDNDGGAHHEGF